jgi:acetylxylan esterase
MVQQRIPAVLLLGGLVLFSGAAPAASLKQVMGWTGGVTLPTDVSMWVYVPDKMVAKPPLLAVIHFCGGSAQAVFGQAQGGGLVSAADQYGFVLVLPSNANASGANGRCWDVTSKKAQTRDGGGDTHAIAQMMKFALTEYQANPDRVYATGDSSGGMTTQLLLGLYPDVYKAGSAFAGVPAGCTNAFDGAGLCGLPAQSAQQWGDRVRAMHPGYTGRRPRVQLFHGDKDDTIKYPNHGEAIKEWVNVLELDATPTMTEMGVSLGTHQATRQRWKNECGYVTLDAFTSVGGDHGPSDALFEAEYVVPFLGLDKPGPVDPEIEQCSPGAGGSGGTGGGGAAAGGTSGANGGGGAPSGGAAGASAGAGAGGGPSMAGAGGAGLAGGPAGGTPSTAGASASAGSSTVTPMAGSAGSVNGAPPIQESGGCSFAAPPLRSPWGASLGLFGAVAAAAFAQRRARRRA